MPPPFRQSKGRVAARCSHFGLLLLAGLLTEPDANEEKIRRRYCDDPALGVPATVFNALRRRPERVAADP